MIDRWTAGVLRGTFLPFLCLQSYETCEVQVRNSVFSCIPP